MRHPETSLFGSHFEMLGGDSKAQHIHNRIAFGIDQRPDAHGHDTAVVASSLHEPHELPGDPDQVPAVI